MTAAMLENMTPGKNFLEDYVNPMGPTQNALARAHRDFPRFRIKHNAPGGSSFRRRNESFLCAAFGKSFLV